MNKFKFYFIALCALGTLLFSCNKSDDTIYEPLHFYSQQYPTDTLLIYNYLKTHYIEQIVDHPGFPDDQDIVMSQIPLGHTTVQPIWDSPMLKHTEILFNNLNYKVYYLQLREGDAVNGQSPSRVDQILTAYDGSFLEENSVELDTLDNLGNPIPKSPAHPEGPFKTIKKTRPVNTQFEAVPFPTGFMSLTSMIPGWPQIYTLFKTGTIEAVSGPNPATYNNFGAGVMFLPSGLGYYEVEKATIPKYSPLMFSFKLYDIKRADHDKDGILDIDEDLNHDGLFTNDDTDGDGMQDYLDVDDDGDGFLTLYETKYVLDGTTYYYPYNGAAVDDPATPIDERRGIPRKFTGELLPGTTYHVPVQEDFTDPTRLRIHLDNTYPQRAN